jgi:hypothetical protein
LVDGIQEKQKSWLGVDAGGERRERKRKRKWMGRALLFLEQKQRAGKERGMALSFHV